MLDQLDVEAPVTQEPNITALDDKLPRVDPARMVFITSRRTEIPLSNQMVSSLILERISSDGKPRIPRVEVTLLGKYKELQANPKDPGYLALLAEWESERKIATMRYIFVVGVKGTPPAEFVAEHRLLFPDATDAEMKYLWVASMLPDDDIDAFTEAVLGRNLVTGKGLEEAGNFSASGSTGNP